MAKFKLSTITNIIKPLTPAAIIGTTLGTVGSGMSNMLFYLAAGGLILLVVMNTNKPKMTR
jgi:hypothetical protein